MLESSVAIVILAAGKASRMGEGWRHKLLAEFDGVPLVRRSALTALAADAASVIIDESQSEPIERGLDLAPAMARDDNNGG
ncbi:NTP transferase domain-containing protein, partial [Rhizobium johnstonii]|uniref:NTP transferase domain-containing protein n=1 Tax=Rhizobium johnstonii TaxID=3019933 RepID=UPI003F96F3F7